MRPQVVSMACRRVQELVDRSMAEGELHRLPPELAAHVVRCPRCTREWQETEWLFARLRGAAAQVDLGQVPRVVDAVLSATVGQAGGIAGETDVALPDGAQGARTAREAEWAGEAAGAASLTPKRRAHTRWVLGQIAAAVALLAITAGGVAYTALMLNEVVSGVEPGQVVERISAPFRQLTQAMFRGAR